MFWVLARICEMLGATAGAFAMPLNLLRENFLGWAAWLDPLPTPEPLLQPVAVQERGDSNMPDVLIYEVELPLVPESSDVASQELKILVGGDEQIITLPPTATKAEGVEVLQDADVRLELRYIDDAGNRSAPGAINFTATDTIPPDAPGPFGAITLVGEEEERPPAEPSPAPEPGPEPEPSPAPQATAKKAKKSKIKMFDTGGRGRKQCPACQKHLGVRNKVCACGHNF